MAKKPTYEDLEKRIRLLEEESIKGKQAENKLREVLQRLNFHMENTPLGVVEFNRNFQITYWSKQTEKIFGWNVEEVMGKRIDQLRWVHEDDVQRVAELSADMIASHHISSLHINRNYRKDGSIIICEWYNSALLNATGELISVLSLILDITERKHMEEEVQKSGERYRAVVEDQTELICRWFSDGTLSFVNEAYCRFFGKQRNEFVGKSFTPLIHEEDHYAVNKQISSLTSSKTSGTIEHRVIGPNGELRWMQWNNKAILGLEGQILEYQSVGRDITERRRLEKALHESRQQNEFLADIIRLSSQPFAMAYPDGRIELFNTAYEKLTGYHADELRTLNWATGLTAPEWRNTEQRKLAELHRTGQPVQYTKEYIRKDGSRVAIELLVHLVSDREGIQGYYAFVNDITDRKRAEAALRESEERFRIFMDNSPGIAWIKDEEGRYVFLSKSYQRRFGLKDDDWHGKTDLELWPGKTAEVFHKNDLAVLHDGGTQTVLEELFSPDGTKSYWWSFKFLLEDANGRKYIGGSGVDITERRQAEEELRKHRNNLEKMVKKRTGELETKTRLLEETNTALRFLLDQRTKDKGELEDNIMSNVHKLVAPYLDKLKNSPLPPQAAAYARIIDSSLREITSPFTNKLSTKFLNLTVKEIEVANLITEGKSTKEIAKLLNSTDRAIKFHRANIRRKLGLKKTSKNLATYLLSLSK